MAENEEQPTAAQTNESDELGDDECAICYDKFTEPAVAPCGHTFCKDCIMQALGASAPVWAGLCPMCRRTVSLYDLRLAGSDKPLAAPARTTPFGEVFVQLGGVGVASYHFDAEDDVYISYANAPESWKLEGGAPPPQKKPFTQTSYDAETRTFKGVIEWEIPFNGESRWDYTIVFPPDFCAISGGHVRMTDGTQQPFSAPWGAADENGLRYTRWSAPATTVFGGVYVQGFQYIPGAEGVASYHFNSETDSYISYSNAPPHWTLADGASAPRQKPFLNASYDAESRTFRGTIDWSSNNFNGDARWEYEIVFSEDFRRIIDGGMQGYNAAGGQSRHSRFVDPSTGNLFFVRNSLRYVEKPRALIEGPQLLLY